MELQEIDALLDRHRERFRRLIRSIVAEESGPDPFSFPLSQYRQLSDEERAALVRRAGVIARDRVDSELAKTGAAWIVLVGDRTVATSTDSTSSPDPERLLALGDTDDLVPFLFEASLIEELIAVSKWSALGHVDAYPTVRLGIETARGRQVVDGDLDTGAHATLLDAALVGQPTPTWFEGRHLGQTFLWAPIATRITLATASGSTLDRILPVRVVRDWSGSSFARINPLRRVLVGRDLLRAFALTVTLATPDRTTTIASGG